MEQQNNKNENGQDEDEISSKDNNRTTPAETDHIDETCSKSVGNDTLEKSNDEQQLQQQTPGISSESSTNRNLKGQQPSVAVKRHAGLSSLVGSITKKSKKQSVLEKSASDWRNFVQEEHLEEELNSHLRSKDAYLERQDFLLRADHSQFERERDLRAQQRKTQQGTTKPG